MVENESDAFCRRQACLPPTYGTLLTVVENHPYYLFKMLNREEIEKLIKDEQLIEGFIDLNTQLTPNGIDLTAASVFEFYAQGAVDFSSKERVILFRYSSKD